MSIRDVLGVWVSRAGVSESNGDEGLSLALQLFIDRERKKGSHLAEDVRPDT